MSDQPSRTSKNSYIFGFIILLSFICALILSLLSSALKKSQTVAKGLDRSQQMMIAANVMNHRGNFLIKDAEGKYVLAKYKSGGYLVASETEIFPTQEQIIEIFQKRFLARLTDDSGNVYTFEEAKINENEYVDAFRKQGYYTQPYRLFYEVLPNEKDIGKDTQPIGYVIPVNGFGLWDAIYGYLTIAPDGDTVIGISWYDQKETPGLGANISEPDWQSQFPGKLIFQESPDGTTHFQTAQIGITVVRGRVSEVLGNSPKAKSAVDGMSGATLTGNGVTSAYRDVLSAYRPFLLNIHKKYEERNRS